MKKIFKRLLAYLIDILIITSITNLISNTTLINPNLGKYQKYNKEYSQMIISANGFILKLQDYYQDNKLTTKEYEKLIKNYPDYEEKLQTYYKEEKLTKKDYKKLVKDTTEEYQTKLSNLSYKMEKNSIPQMIISIIITLLYFIGFNYITNGQTLGKKLLRLKIVNIDNEKISILNYTIRTLIMYETASNLIKLIMILILSKNNYLEATSVVYTIQNVLDIAIIATIILRSDGRGLHDILAKTKVVAYDKTGNEIE